MIKRLFLIGIIPFIFLLDRFSKIWICGHFSPGEGWLIWPGIFHLTLVHNTGAAFGILKNYGFILIIVSIVCAAALAIYLRHAILTNSVTIRSFASALVMAGALGNLTDRLRYGYVIDFLDFRIWPVFNIADTSISVGVGLIAVTLFKRKE